MVTISAETTLKGELKSKGRLRVDGRIEGDGEVDGTVMLSERGRWTGNIAADIVVIQGTVEGDVTGWTKVEVHPKARVKGRLLSPTILIHPGAQINGDLLMRTPAALRLLEDKARNSAEFTAPFEEAEPVRRMAGQ